SSSLALGDFDEDSRLDLVLGGSTGLASFTRLYLNVGALLDTPPAAPEGVEAHAVAGGIVVVWNASTDPETAVEGLSYNLRVRELPTYREVLPSLAREDGPRLVPATGVARPPDPFPSRGLSAPSGVYLVAVQAVDPAFLGGEW